jgi:hypothetical protein
MEVDAAVASHTSLTLQPKQKNRSLSGIRLLSVKDDSPFRSLDTQVRFVKSINAAVHQVPGAVGLHPMPPFKEGDAAGKYGDFALSQPPVSNSSDQFIPLQTGSMDIVMDLHEHRITLWRGKRSSSPRFLNFLRRNS